MDPLLIVLTVFASIILTTIIGFAIFEPAIILGDGFNLTAHNEKTAAATNAAATNAANLVHALQTTGVLPKNSTTVVMAPKGHTSGFPAVPSGVPTLFYAGGPVSPKPNPFERSRKSKRKNRSRK